MAFKGQSNGGIDLLKKRDREDEDGEVTSVLKKEKPTFQVPQLYYPPRNDIPPLPTIDIHNYTMITSVIKLKQNIPFSIYNLNGEDKIEEGDGIERYSNRFTFTKNRSTSSIESKLPGIPFGYFPYDLVVNKRKTKKRVKVSNKSLDGLQKEEEEGEKNQEEGVNLEEEEEEEEEDEGDYAEENIVDDDEDMSDPEDGGDERETFF
ncbi:hypothetical protein DICPUDRAFT_81232 [Dictyostelium purpureum]|uniref:DNA-directed RNA polymerase III subunit n=1 Tax=Dictyostelium purpureum TaxID=5786 RepID=F0ZSV8_DICPU|nr:uncharacterized protein DICPUDRAFT_81232 [Dictyostelium purpureum]EGC32976.1 hypothetical protein DICPUDRAFT_81232 [Dictyostelium purpureum]|eukprot:XP_003290494.1 hypothetical protein DICPUDRAFT_81232 [Dictyostelium purpureum]